MDTPANRTPEQEAAEIAALWYVPPLPPPPAGWLIYSERFLLRALWGPAADPLTAAVPASRRFWVGVIRGLLAAAQILLMFLSVVPFLSLVMERIAVYYKRGKVGSFIRACYWKTKAKHLGQDTLIDRDVEIGGAEHIAIGANCLIDNGARLIAGQPGDGKPGAITIGDCTHVGPRCHLLGRGGLRIGSYVALEAGVYIYSATNTLVHPVHPGQLISMSHMAPEYLQNIVQAPVTIGDFVTVGFNCLLLPGVQLGNCAVVHPFTVVMKSFPAYANVSGPGRARQNGWRRPPKLDPRRENQVPTPGTNTPPSSDSDPAP